MAKKLGDAGPKGFKVDKGSPPTRFYLGYDKKEAERRKANIEAFWDALSEETWSDWSLIIARSIAKGQPVDTSDLGSLGVAGHAFRLVELQEKFPMVVFAVPEIVQEEIASIATGLGDEQGKFKRRATNVTLFQAFDDWCAWIRTQSRFLQPGSTKLRTGAKRLINYTKLIKRHQSDMPLSAYGAKQIENMLNYWEGRPVIASGEMAAVDTAKDTIKAIRRFNRWLNKSELPWRMPSDYDDERRHVQETQTEIAAKGATQVETFTIAEIKTLWEHARPIHRLVLLLGLNCGFGRAEVGSLYQSEIVNGQIKRVRRKTGVYGQWVLWDETKKAIEWYSKRRSHSDAPELLVTRNGKPMQSTSDDGNQRTDLSNLWYGLLDRVAIHHPEFGKGKPRRLTFNKLRKTAGNWVRKIAGGEIMKIFHSRGKPVSGDVHSERYSDRPFKKVYKAIRIIERKLGLSAEWLDKVPNASKGMQQAKRVQALRMQGYKIIKIAEITGLHRDTVRKFLKPASQPVG